MPRRFFHARALLLASVALLFLAGCSTNVGFSVGGSPAAKHDTFNARKEQFMPEAERGGKALTRQLAEAVAAIPEPGAGVPLGIDRTEYGPLKFSPAAEGYEMRALQTAAHCFNRPPTQAERAAIKRAVARLAETGWVERLAHGQEELHTVETTATSAKFVEDGRCLEVRYFSEVGFY